MAVLKQVSQAYAARIVLRYTRIRTESTGKAYDYLVNEIAKLHNRMIAAEDALDAELFRPD